MSFNHDFAKGLVATFNRLAAEYMEIPKSSHIPDSPYTSMVPLDLDWDLKRCQHDLLSGTGAQEIVSGLQRDMGATVARLVKTGFIAGWLAAHHSPIGEGATGLDMRSTLTKLMDTLWQERGGHGHDGCPFPVTLADFKPHWEAEKQNWYSG